MCLVPNMCIVLFLCSHQTRGNSLILAWLLLTAHIRLVLEIFTETVVEAARSAARRPPTRAKHAFVEHLPKTFSFILALCLCISLSAFRYWFTYVINSVNRTNVSMCFPFPCYSGLLVIWDPWGVICGYLVE